LQDRVTRFDPIVELVIVFGTIMGISWLVLPIAQFSGQRWLYWTGWVIIAVIFVWMFGPGTYLRRRSLHDLGLCTYKDFAANVQRLRTRRDPWNWIVVIFAIMVIYLLFLTNFTVFTGDIPVIQTFNKLLENYLKSMGSSTYNVGIIVLATLEYTVFVIAFACFLLKTDTLKDALWKYAKYGIPFLLFLFFYALIRYPGKATSVTFVNALSFFFGYVFWAFLQQIPLLIYTNTMLRDGIERHEIMRNGENRFQTKYFDNSKRFKGKEIPYEQRKRLLVTLITALLFAMVHLPAWFLSFDACLMEFIIAYFYWDPKTRNVLALCILHAAAGVLIVFFIQMNLKVGYVALFN
jgi:hypothetical protein